MRVGVVDHPHQRGVVDDQRMRLGQQFVLLGGIEGLLGLVDQRVDLRVFVAAPVDADRRDLARMEEADDGVKGIRG
ncbi:uridine kinase [Bradyrhizobium sp. LB7.1]